MDQKVFDIIDKISREHSNKTFGYLKKEDIKNEIWTICLERLPYYKPLSGNLENWLRVVVSNRLVNRFKDITKSVRSPCPRCPFYDKGNSPSDCAKFGDERHLCTKWHNYILSTDSRNSLLNSIEQQNEQCTITSMLDKAVGSEFEDYIIKKISGKYRYDLNEFISSGKLSKQKFKKLKKEIVRVLTEDKNSGFDIPVNLTIKGKRRRKRRSKNKSKVKDK